MALLEFLNTYQLNKLTITRPSGNEVEKSARRIERLADGLDGVSVKPTNDVLDSVINQLRSNQVLLKKELKLMAFGGLEHFEKISDGENLLENFFKLLSSAGSRIIFKSLLLGYFRVSHEDFPFIAKKVRNFLSKNIDSLPERWLIKVKKYDLLGVDVGRILANQIIHNLSEDVFSILEDSGLKKGILISGGFIHQVFKQTCIEISKEHHLNNLNRFFELLDENYVGEPQLPLVQTHSGDISAITHALLNPYINETPDPAVKNRIENFLLDRFEDPRINVRRWNRVDEKYRTVLSRWLTKESFELLMKVLTSSNDTSQWAARSKFWSFYIDNELVTDAWVAFGPDAFSKANTLVKNGTIKSRGAYAQLEKSNIELIHSVIFMKIGDLVISEWTHDGKVRIYKAGNQRVPKFYLNRYSPQNLRSDVAPDYKKIHLGYWQNDVEDYIYNETGIKGPFKSKYSRKYQPETSDSLGELGQATCSSCGTATQKRWLTVPEGKCMSCVGNKVRTR